MRPLTHPAWLISIQRRIKDPLALFLDFDGTVVPIAPRPEKAWLPPATRLLLRSLSRFIPVVIVTGRSLRDIRPRIGLTEITYVGNHGLEIAGPGFNYRIKDAIQCRRLLRSVMRQLQRDLGRMPGILLEDKGYTLSVHYRLARGETRQKAARLFTKRLKPFQDRGLIKISRGKAVWEIRPPVNWNKGKAVLWILEQPAFKGRWPLYIGDDRTDRDAFRAIRDCGIGILVGPSQESMTAHYRLKDPIEVHGFLKWLLRQLMHREVRIYGEGSCLRNGGG